MRSAAICFACAIFACAAADERRRAPATDPVFERTSQRTAVPGKPARLDFLYLMKIDCSTDAFDVRVSMRAEHGEVTFAETQDTPRVARDSPLAHCKEKVAGKYVGYQAAAGYSGSDSATVEMTAPAGAVYRITYLIDVSDDPRVVRLDPPPKPPVVAVAPPARRETTSRPLGPYEFDCDAPEAASTTWSGPLPSGPAVIAGTIKLVVTRKHETFIPMGGVVFFGSNPDIAASLSFVAFPQKPGNVDAMITLRATPTAAPRRIALVSLPAADKIPFTVRLEAGSIDVTVAETKRRVKIDFLTPSRVSLSCSSAEFLFENVTITD
jgi:hypothetical protein